MSWNMSRVKCAVCPIPLGVAFTFARARIVDPADRWHPFAVDTMPRVGPIDVPPEMPGTKREVSSGGEKEKCALYMHES
jgi:hypothetical protein